MDIRHRILIAIVLMLGVQRIAAAASIDLSELDTNCTIRAQASDGRVVVQWHDQGGSTVSMTLNAAIDRPLIESISRNDVEIVSSLDPALLLTVGIRDLSTAGKWTTFFDNPIKRPHEPFPAKLTRDQILIEGHGSRATVRVTGLTAGKFAGNWLFTIYDGTRLIRSEAVLKTAEPAAAILYDAGLVRKDVPPDWSAVYVDNLDQPERVEASHDPAGDVYAVRRRAIALQTSHGSIALIAPPHQFLYPLDFCNNYKLAWHGPNYRNLIDGWGIGLRQPPEGDKRWVPWVNAPPGTEQHLVLFYLISPRDGDDPLTSAARLTHDDTFKPLPGYQTFTSHMHVEHTVDLLSEWKRQGDHTMPARLVEPDFVQTLKRTGVNIAHLAEFHIDHKDIPADRLTALRTLHHECERLSNEHFLLLPGEEPNVHLGGHWISLFPKPVLWTLDRRKDQPFSESIGGETVYHVGNADDVLQLMNAEHGLMWTAHPRVKGSLGFPDLYRDTRFFKSDRFLGGAWKNLPVDDSLDRLGTRVLDLLDDMNNWGDHKVSPGEIDLFKIDPTCELYGHMNINYLKLDRLPKFGDGWTSILDCLRGGRFFVTTGEVLIPNYSVSGVESGGRLPPEKAKSATIDADLEWTYPLAFAEIVSGDGHQTFHQRVDLTDTSAFGTRHLRLPVDLTGRTWVRFEVWDVATNGAFTQPIWIE